MKLDLQQVQEAFPLKILKNGYENRPKILKDGSSPKSCPRHPKTPVTPPREVHVTREIQEWCERLENVIATDEDYVLGLEDFGCCFLRSSCPSSNKGTRRGQTSKVTSSHTHTCEIGWCASTLRRFLIYVYTLYVYTLYVYTLHCWCASTLRRFFVLCVYTLYVYTLYIKQLYTWTTIHMYSICNGLYFQVMCKQWYVLYEYIWGGWNLYYCFNFISLISIIYNSFKSIYIAYFL